MPPEKIEHLLQYKENSVWVKQKSEMWEQLRQYSVITGSTCSNVIGLTTLADQKKHFDTFVLNKKEEISEQLQQRFDHGVEFEKRAVATLVGLLLPALFPICHKLFEVGPVYADSEFHECMLEVSADGILKCDMGGENCPHGCCTGGETFSLEIKRPVSDNIYYENKYFIPKHNYPQVLCQQFVHTAFKGLFVTCTQESVILNCIDENIDLWNNLATVIFDTYRHDTLKKPTKLHPKIPVLRKNLDHCSHENVVTLGEVPTYSCSDTDFTDADYNSPYVLEPPVHPEISDVAEIIQQLKIISIECQNIFSKCSDLSRQKATELLIFMASDSNRMKGNDQVSYSHPTGYVLKGNSLPVKKMRSLVDIQRNTFHMKSIPILCESFDGQWANLAFESADGFPLTLVHLQKHSWSNACNLSKGVLL